MAKHLPDGDDRLDAVLGALADPSRRRILALLTDGEATVGAVGAPLGLAPSTVSKHLVALERAQLVSRRVEGRRHWISLDPAGFRLAGELIAFYGDAWGTGPDRGA